MMAADQFKNRGMPFGSWHLLTEPLIDVLIVFGQKNLVAIKRVVVERGARVQRVEAHLAIVVDDFGSIAGLVTMEDLMETLLGIEIMDETDTVADLQKLARAEWQKRAKELGTID